MQTRLLQLAAFVLVQMVAGGAALGDDKVPVGVTLPLTSDYAFVGEEIRRGLSIAEDDGLLEDVRLIYEDTQAVDRLKAVSAAQKLAAVDRVQLAFDFGVTTTVPMAPIYGARSIPIVVLWDSNQKQDTLGNHVFSMGFSTEAAGEDMLSFALNRLHSKKIAILSLNEEWSQTISNAFRKALKANPAELVLDTSFEYGESDARSIALRVVRANPDSVYAPLFGISLHAMVRQLRGLGYKGHLLFGDACVDDDIKALGPLLDNAYATQVFLESPEYAAKYRSEFGSNSMYRIGFSAVGYDAGKLMHEVFLGIRQKGKPLVSSNILEALRSVSFTGITGAVGFSPGRPLLKREKIVRISSGEFVRP